MESFAIDGTWSFPRPLRYFAVVVVVGLAIRVFHSALRAMKEAHDTNHWDQYFGILLRQVVGFQPKGSGRSDYGYTYILGLLELGIYGPLIAANAWAMVGAWIGLKTLAQWNVWSDDRSVFNLFLIGTLTVVLAAYLFVAPLVIFTPSPVSN